MDTLRVKLNSLSDSQVGVTWMQAEHGHTRYTDCHSSASNGVACSGGPIISKSFAYGTPPF
jgi:hypothetical protein